MMHREEEWFFLELHSGSRLTCGLCLHARTADNRSVIYGDAGLLHEKLDLENLVVVRISLSFLAEGIEVSSDDLLTACFLADLIVNYAETCHVDTHVSR